MAFGCEHVLAHIQDYSRALLDDNETAQFETHLESCIHCRQKFCSFCEREFVGAAQLDDLAALAPGSIRTSFRRSATDEPSEFESDYAPWVNDRLTQAKEIDKSEPVRVGNLRIVRRIASGGMGSVYEAIDEVTQRRVAIKLLRIADKRPHAMLRMLREAKVMARLNHPNIVAIHDVKYFDGGPALVMEYVDGKPLNRWQRGKPLKPELAAALVREIALAIDHAHQRGVVHRDLKPSNILILNLLGEAELDDHRKDFPRIKLTDFGISQLHAHGKEVDDLTNTGEILGTPTYMSPEQTRVNDGHIGPASDIYNLGTILFELLCGIPPFAAADPVETLMKIREQSPPRPGSITTGIPKNLEKICLRCLAKSPSKRYASADAVAQALEAFLLSRHSPDESGPVTHGSNWLSIRGNGHTLILSGAAIGFFGFLIGGLFLADWIPWGQGIPKTSAAMIVPKPTSSPPLLSGERSVDTELEQVKNQTLARWLNKFEGLSNLQIVSFLESMKDGLPALEAKYPEDPQLIQIRGMLFESEGDSARDVNDHAKSAERYEQACSLVEKLTKITPDDPAAYGYHSLLLDQLAKAYRALDDHPNMIKASEKSMQIQCSALNRWPYLPEMRIRMAERSVGRLIILLDLNLKPEAIECVEEAIRTLRSKPFSPKWQTAAERLHSDLSLFASELRKTLNPAN